MIKTKIVNVVATAALEKEIDFVKLRSFREISHDSDVYGGRVAYFKTSSMKGKVSIFASGKMISVGTKSEGEAFCELEYAKNFLVKKGLVIPTSLRPKVQNIVVTVDFGESLDLEKLAKTCKMIYEPEQFPGGILKLKEEYNVSVLIFASGKVVITGLKSSNYIKPTTQKIKDIMRTCK
jgi:transcription initiation factor TFIID TATA-box-binding protein